MPIQQSSGIVPQMANPADIVFLLDASGSMSDCFEGLKNHVGEFIAGLDANPNFRIDFRLGILSAGCASFQKKDFNPDPAEFRRAMSRMRCGDQDELTLPALDWALDFDWRRGAHKVIVLFTDEPIEGGAEPEFQTSRLDDLVAKAATLRAKLFVFGPVCPHLERLCREVPGSLFSLVDDHEAFFGAGFGSVLSQIGKNVSRSCGTGLQAPAGSTVRRDIYGLVSLGTPGIEHVSV